MIDLRLRDIAEKIETKYRIIQMLEQEIAKIDTNTAESTSDETIDLCVDKTTINNTDMHSFSFRIIQTW